MNYTKLPVVLAFSQKVAILNNIFMYYSHPCSYCHKIFYVYADDRNQGAKALYAGIKKHLIDYGEDDKEYDFDDGPSIDTNEVYGKISESSDPPSGGYIL